MPKGCSELFTSRIPPLGKIQAEADFFSGWLALIKEQTRNVILTFRLTSTWPHREKYGPGDHQGGGYVQHCLEEPQVGAVRMYRCREEREKQRKGMGGKTTVSD